MSIDSLQTEILVQEIMSSPVITLSKDSPVVEAAKMMKELHVGSIVILDGNGNPIGIVTKTDIVDRVLAENKNSSNVQVGEIMSTPLITVDATAKIQDAAKLMRNKRVTRLVVIYKGKLAGLVSTRDLLRVTPELIDILSEKAMIEKGELTSGKRSPIIGYCDGCGQWSDSLEEIDGEFYCPDCLIDLYKKE